MTLDESLEKRGPVRGREPEGQAWCVGLHRLGTTGAKGGLEEVLGEHSRLLLDVRYADWRQRPLYQVVSYQPPPPYLLIKSNHRRSTNHCQVALLLSCLSHCTLERHLAWRRAHDELQPFLFAGRCGPALGELPCLRGSGGWRGGGGCGM